ncbi:MAG: ABC transporter ATP-binding protein [Candidatus Amulumruptor sp.]|nr:ABC transporter ATP-binding protein [Candidatus Amulumruptor sp.]
MLTIDSLSFAYRGRHSRKVLDRFSLTLEPGNICGLLGPNGAGKSTLFYLTAGLLTPASGSIDYNGFTPRRRDTAFMSDIFLVPEEIALPSMTLRKFVAVNSPFYPRWSAKAMNRYLDMFELTPDIHFDHLSMGQRKKAFMSFALACNTGLVLMDEPANGIDIPGKSAFRRAVVESMTDDRTIIISTHQVHDIDRIIDHVVVMDNERVRLNAPISEIASQLKFGFTTDNAQAQSALVSVPVPGGFNIIEPYGDCDTETEVDLETLFLLTRNNPELINRLFNK